MHPETIDDVLTRLESAVEKMTIDARPSLLRECLEDVVLALRMLAAQHTPVPTKE